MKRKIKMRKYSKEHPSEILFRLGKQQKLIPVDYSGRVIKNPHLEGIGFADKIKRKRKVMNSEGEVFEKTFVDRVFVGFVWLETEFADPDFKWVVEVYGKDYLNKIFDIVEKARFIYSTEIYPEYFEEEFHQPDVHVYLYSSYPISIKRLNEVRTYHILKTFYRTDEYYEDFYEDFDEE